MPYRKRTNKRRAAPKRKFRERIARTIPYANQKPASIMVRFQGRKKYLVAPDNASANEKTILRIPASYMGDPFAEHGSFLPDSANAFVEGTDNMFSKYQHYKVMGAQCMVTIKPYGNTNEPGVGQQQNLAFLARVPEPSTYSSATEVASLETNYGIVQKQFSTAGVNGYRQASLKLGYSPKKEHNIKDIQDNAHIRVVAEYDVPAPENTYFNVILSGELDSVLLGHANAIMTVQTNYLIALEEPTTQNQPTMLAVSTQ